MKKYMIIILILLAGCSNQIDYKSISKDIKTIQMDTENFATGNGDYEKLKEDTRIFNEKLNQMDLKDDEVNRFIRYQKQANQLRLEGIKDMDSDTITESAKYQDMAQGIYNKLEGSN